MRIKTTLLHIKVKINIKFIPAAMNSSDEKLLLLLVPFTSRVVQNGLLPFFPVDTQLKSNEQASANGTELASDAFLLEKSGCWCRSEGTKSGQSSCLLGLLIARKANARCLRSRRSDTRCETSAAVLGMLDVDDCETSLLSFLSLSHSEFEESRLLCVLANIRFICFVSSGNSRVKSTNTYYALLRIGPLVSLVSQMVVQYGSGAGGN